MGYGTISRKSRDILKYVYMAGIDSLSPIRDVTAISGLRIDWGSAGSYFEGLEDPYKSFEITYTDANGREVRTSMSTAQLLKIQRDAYLTAQNNLSAILAGLQESGIVATRDSLAGSPGLAAAYPHLRDAPSLLTSYPFTNDVYFPDMNAKVEGMAVPRGVQGMYLTPKAFNPSEFPTSALIETMEAIYTNVKMLHDAANANASLSPAVSIAMSRLGNTGTLFGNLDDCARDPLVPKNSRVPDIIQRRGAWADNRFFGDTAGNRTVVYSDKNTYMPGLGNFNDARVPEIYRDGPNGGGSTRYVNPTFPDYLFPLHFATLPPTASPTSAGFSISGPSDIRWMHSANLRRPMWTWNNFGETTGYGVTNLYQGSDSSFVTDVNIGGRAINYNTRTMSSFLSADPSRAERRLRDWYLSNKPRNGIYIADAMTDFACAVQLARFMSVVPPHVLLHSCLGFHNALLKLSFQQCEAPYSTAISEFNQKMRIERAGIAATADRLNLINPSGTTEPGYALTVKAPDSVVMADAGLQSMTVASLSIAAAATAANPIAGVVCFALAGCAILVAEIMGARAQALITPRDRSREPIRYDFRRGIQTNWQRGYTPEWVINSSPVHRI